MNALPGAGTRGRHQLQPPAPPATHHRPPPLPAATGVPTADSAPLLCLGPAAQAGVMVQQQRLANMPARAPAAWRARRRRQPLARQLAAPRAAAARSTARARLRRQRSACAGSSPPCRVWAAPGWRPPPTERPQQRRGPARPPAPAAASRRGPLRGGRSCAQTGAKAPPAGHPPAPRLGPAHAPRRRRRPAQRRAAPLRPQPAPRVG